MLVLVAVVTVVIMRNRGAAGIDGDSFDDTEDKAGKDLRGCVMLTHANYIYSLQMTDHKSKLSHLFSQQDPTSPSTDPSTTTSTVKSRISRIKEKEGRRREMRGEEKIHSFRLGLGGRRVAHMLNHEL